VRDKKQIYCKRKLLWEIGTKEEEVEWVEAEDVEKMDFDKL